MLSYCKHFHIRIIRCCRHLRPLLVFSCARFVLVDNNRLILVITRKLSYCKDDRAMRPMYGCHENFRKSLTTPMATFLKIFNGFFVPIEPINVHAKFEVGSFTGSWDNRGYPKNLGSPWIRPHSLFSKIFNGPNLKSVAFPVPGIKGGTWKNWTVPGYAHAPFSPNILMGLFVPMDPQNVLAKIEIRSFTRSWDNKGYPKNLGSPSIRPHSLSPKFLMGFCSDGPSECTGQIWNP